MLNETFCRCQLGLVVLHLGFKAFAKLYQCYQFLSSSIVSQDRVMHFVWKWEIRAYTNFNSLRGICVQDATFEMERKRNRPEKYNREKMRDTVKAISKIEEVGHHSRLADWLICLMRPCLRFWNDFWAQKSSFQQIETFHNPAEACIVWGQQRSMPKLASSHEGVMFPFCGNLWIGKKLINNK